MSNETRKKRQTPWERRGMTRHAFAAARMTPEATARHEAAHAVVDHVLGNYITSIRLTKTGGVARGHRRRGQKRDPMREGVALLAGACAEFGCPMRPADYSDIGDLAAVKRLGFRGGSIGTLARQSWAFVCMYWEQIEAVSSALLERRELTGREFRKLVKLKRGCAG